MNIVHISTSDISGGAAKVAYALHRSLLELGHRSTMLVGYKKSKDPEIEGVWFNRGIVRRGLNHFLIGKLEEYTGLQYLIQPFRNIFLSHPFVRKADIIQLHNIHGNFFSPTVLPALSQMAPIVWTLHDMWPMSDHCTYPTIYGCNVWKTGKGPCPSLFDYPPIRRDTSEYLWKKKQEIYRKTDLSFVGPSKWMCHMLRTSPLTNRFPINHIPYGMDTDLYSPQDRVAARKLLNIPLGASVIMISSYPHAPRKGLSYFLESLQYLSQKPNPIIFVTENCKLTEPYKSKFSFRPMGSLQSPQKLCTYLSASDIFVLPTLADNLPLSNMEAFACGVPVVSFDVGGVSDMVRHMETGYLAKYKDVKDLANGMDLLLENEALRKKIGAQARTMMLSEYSLRTQAERYVQLYKERLSLRETFSRM